MNTFLLVVATVILLLIFTVAESQAQRRHRHRHRHRYRHRHRQSFNASYDLGVSNAIEDMPSLNQQLFEANVTEVIRLPVDDAQETAQSLCSNKSYKEKVLDSIIRTLKFYESHVETLDEEDYGAGIAFLKGVERKHGKDIFKSYPLDQWVLKTCECIPEPNDKDFCLAYAKGLEMFGETNFTRIESSVLNKAAEKYKNIGNEKEHIYVKLNSDCLGALLLRCEVPNACERVMYDPQPHSQYMLTHQLFHRIFASQADCLTEKEKYVGKDVELELCAKMYKEAKFIVEADKLAPITDMRDLFAEQISFCGYMGYDSFLRPSWLEKLLSWQSKSEFGCYTHVDNLEDDSDEILRKLTQAEIDQGLKESGEYCNAHFTSVGLDAMATFWDYIEENCH